MTNVVTMPPPCGSDKAVSNYFIGVLCIFCGKRTAEDTRERAALLLTTHKEIIYHLLRIRRQAHSYSLLKQN